MHDTFKALSVKALQDNHQSFLDLASATLAKYVTSAQKEFDIRNQAVEKTVYPLREALDRYEHHLQSMERHRAKAYGGLMQQMDMLADAHRKLQLETGKLAKALRKPHVRGRWGEMTLKRVVELSGMMNRCDFIEQPTKQTEQGLLRPDMVINLPDQRQIIVDAKVPLEAYLEAIEAETETKRNAKLADHLRQLQTHINQLSQKAYWKHFRPTPEFVILFIPGENFYSAALMQRPQLIEDAARKRIVLATPSTLISLLKAVAYGWQQAAAAENARIIADLGRELYDRLSHITQHLNKLGKEIDRSVATYNTLIGSFERRLLTTARKFQGLGVASDQPRPQPALETVKSRPTKLTRDS
jgi:DNA recombination protein RmuC